MHTIVYFACSGHSFATRLLCAARTVTEAGFEQAITSIGPYLGESCGQTIAADVTKHVAPLLFFLWTVCSQAVYFVLLY
jgi:hypothetical protein